MEHPIGFAGLGRKFIAMQEMSVVPMRNDDAEEKHGGGQQDNVNMDNEDLDFQSRTRRGVSRGQGISIGQGASRAQACQKATEEDGSKDEKVDEEVVKTVPLEELLFC